VRQAPTMAKAQVWELGFQVVAGAPRWSPPPPSSSGWPASAAAGPRARPAPGPAR
jgi:hypothetical protein